MIKLLSSTSCCKRAKRLMHLITYLPAYLPIHLPTYLLTYPPTHSLTQEFPSDLSTYLPTSSPVIFELCEVLVDLVPKGGGISFELGKHLSEMK